MFCTTLVGVLSNAAGVTAAGTLGIWVQAAALVAGLVPVLAAQAGLPWLPLSAALRALLGAMFGSCVLERCAV